VSAALLHEALEKLNGDGVEAALGYFAEDFEGVVPPELSGEPDQYHGHDGVRRYFDLFMEVVDDLLFEIEKAVDISAGGVAAIAHVTGRGHGSGLPMEMRVPLAVRVREGKITRMAGHPTWDEAVAAAA
jgi:ketosteroid isomerase-like protein